MDSQFPINQILQRYQLPSDKDLLYSYEEFRRISIDQEFIYTLLRSFEDEKTFCAEDYQNFSLEIILDYISKTHRYYFSKKLCEIEQTINILLKDYSSTHPLLHILNSFFSGYTAGLSAHINSEEKYLLPYIKCLLKFENEKINASDFFAATNNYSLQKFIDNHHDTEKDLSNVKEAILNYEPPESNQTPYRILLTQIDAFEKDLSVHALIEDSVLIPRALQLEKKINDFLLT